MACDPVCLHEQRGLCRSAGHESHTRSVEVVPGLEPAPSSRTGRRSTLSEAVSLECRREFEGVLCEETADT